MAVDEQVGVPAGWEVVPPKAAAMPAAATDKPRQDSNAVGVDHDWIVRKWADFASKHLGDKAAPIAAYIGTLLSDIPASILEAASAPESIATMGVGGVPAALPEEAARYASTPLAEHVQAAGRALQRVPAGGKSGLVTRAIGSALEAVPTPMAAGYDRYMVNTPATVMEAMSKMKVTAGDVSAIKNLVMRGASEADAIKQVLGK